MKNLQHLCLGLTFFCSFALVSPRADAATTYICNETNETLYVAVRHFANSIFTANARTEGWYTLKTRGFLRSCQAFNRSWSNYVVAGVGRNGKVVPVYFRVSGYSTGRKVFLCVHPSDEFTYTSEDISDDSCSSDQMLARASVGVIGGSNDVWIDLSGSTEHID